MNIFLGQWKVGKVLIARWATIPFTWSLNCFDRCNPPPTGQLCNPPSPTTTDPHTNRFNLFSYFDTIRDIGIWSLIDRWLIRNTHNHNKTHDNTLSPNADQQTNIQLSIASLFEMTGHPQSILGPLDTGRRGCVVAFVLACLVCHVLHV